MSEDRDAVYRRRLREDAPGGSAEEQGAVARAELSARGVDVEPPQAAKEFMLSMIVEHEAERTAAVLEEYRPYLVAEFGGETTAAVMDHVGFGAFIAEAYDEIEPDEAAYKVLAHLRDYPGSTPADGFNAVRDQPGA